MNRPRYMAPTVTAYACQSDPSALDNNKFSSSYTFTQVDEMRTRSEINDAIRMLLLDGRGLKGVESTEIIDIARKADCHDAIVSALLWVLKDI